MTYFESIGVDSRITNETSLKTSWAETKSLLGKLPLPGASAGNDAVSIEVDGVFGTSFRTYTKTSSIFHRSAAGTCAKTAAEIENGVDRGRDASTSADTFRDAGGCRGCTDSGVGDGVGGSASSEVEI